MNDDLIDEITLPTPADESAELAEIRNFKGKYPKQLWWLFLAEMWERFSFYGMRGMLSLFLVDELLLSDGEASLQYGATQAFVYTFAFIGGMFADRILGFRKSIFWGGLLMIVGSFTLAFSPKDLFYIGISFTIIGTGFFKPNISTMVGQLYRDGDSRRDAGFSLFYSGINIGALLGGGVCIYVAKAEGWGSWNLAFSLAGIFMIIGLSVFAFTQRTLGPIGQSPVLGNNSPTKSRLYRYMVYAGSLIVIPLILILVSNSQYTDIFMYIVGPLALFYVIYELLKYSPSERKKLFAAIIFIVFSIFFWAFFEQSGGSLSLFAAENLGNDLGGIKIDPNVVNNSSNSFFVILFAPLIGLLFLWMNKRKIEPNSIIKFGIAFLLLALAFYVFYSTKFFAVGGVSPLWIFTLAYLVITFAELFLSPIGLSLMTKLSPRPLHGAMMGMWFLASAYGQYVAGILGSNMSLEKGASLPEKLDAYTNGYYDLAIYGLISGVVLIAISPLIKKLMGSVK